MQTGSIISITKENIGTYKKALYKICRHYNDIMGSMKEYPLELTIGEHYRVVMREPVELIELMLNLELKINSFRYEKING